jgi:Acetyltransferase (GNAT) domain
MGQRWKRGNRNLGHCSSDLGRSPTSSWPASLARALAAPTEDSSETFGRHGAVEFMALRDFPLLLFLCGTAEIVGSSGLHRPDWTVPKMEIGWRGRTSYARQGLVTEAVKAILAVRFTSWPKLTADRRPAAPRIFRRGPGRRSVSAAQHVPRGLALGQGRSRSARRPRNRAPVAPHRR